MTNEEKAREIAQYNVPMPQDMLTTKWQNGRYEGAILMAEWKDQQIKEYLDKKLEIEKSRNHGIETCTMCLLTSIINELFNED